MKPNHRQLADYFEISHMTAWRWQQNKPRVYLALEKEWIRIHNDK